ncbi:hypothetical protein SELMODRAFT_432054 [Selaginella moellendorffii]|uniref:Uncharacterized protein n=1 Tax=Selaginella moellendorffii TaxID=88036 RepID=D8TEU3_SELML|nr:hypothetical protein SELMODRAFT_432054 [Selaginella moellendorffii]
MACTPHGVRLVRENSKDEFVLRITDILLPETRSYGRIIVTDGIDNIEAVVSSHITQAMRMEIIRPNTFLKFTDYAFYANNGKETLTVLDVMYLHNNIWSPIPTYNIQPESSKASKRHSGVSSENESKRPLIAQTAIASLTNRSYKWSFKARVTHKDTLRQFTTKRTVSSTRLFLQLGRYLQIKRWRLCLQQMMNVFHVLFFTGNVLLKYLTSL